MTVYFLDSRIRFPDPSEAEPGGLLAIGGDLSPKRLLLAYENGIFPWYSEEDPILWFSPDPRMVFSPGDFRFSKTLIKTASSGKFSVRVDTDFAAVIEGCAQVRRKGQSGTWITEEMKTAYRKLHELGYAHSFEVYSEESLIGGLYGVSLGGAFFRRIDVSPRNRRFKGSSFSPGAKMLGIRFRFYRFPGSNGSYEDSWRKRNQQKRVSACT